MEFSRKRAIRVITLALVLWVGLSLLAFANSLRITLQIKDQSQLVLDRIEAGDYQAALPILFDIEHKLQSAKRWQIPSKWLRLVPVIRHDYIVYDELLSAGSQLSGALKDILTHLSGSTISQRLSLENLDLQTAPAAYLQVHDEVLASLDHILDAAESIDKLHIELLPAKYQPQLVQLKSKLTSYEATIKEYRPYLELLPSVLGDKDPNDILVILQNPHELRPTGGFIGTYGRITINNGRIEQFYTDDVYNVDVKALGREQLEAPKPFQTYAGVTHWYLRDANWSPDFPTAAQNIKAIYEYESGEQDIDMVVAVTPYLIEEFLRITGPLEADGIVFNSENLIDAIQHRVEQEFWMIGLSNEERKKVINTLANVIKQRIFSASTEEIKEFWAAGMHALDKGEILTFNTDKDTQAQFKEFGWAGEIAGTDSDYLYVVDANIGALKTDRLVTRSRSYEVTEQEDGRMRVRLRLTYRNNGFFDYRTTRYRTYTRVYVPQGSQLIASNGLVDRDKSFISVAPETYNEYGKTVFAGFISVEPGQQRTVTLEYYLPDGLAEKVRNTEKYELFVQKQPGVPDSRFDAVVTLQNKLFSFAPSDRSYRVINERSLAINDAPGQDTVYTVTFRR